MSGWPSGLRRQTQDLESFRDGVFWSTYVGVGSNPTSDNVFLTDYLILLLVYKPLDNRETIHLQYIQIHERPFLEWGFVGHLSLMLYQFDILPWDGTGN